MYTKCTQKCKKKEKKLFILIFCRDPFDSILAEFNRRSGGHIGHASPEKFKKNSGKVWTDFVTEKAREWENMNMDWIKNFQGSLLVIFYQDLVDRLEEQLSKMLDFLSVSSTQEDMDCVIKRKEGIYRRKKKNTDIKKHVYNSHLTSVINKRKSRVLQYVSEINRR